MRKPKEKPTHPEMSRSIYVCFDTSVHGEYRFCIYVRQWIAWVVAATGRIPALSEAWSYG